MTVKILVLVALLSFLSKAAASAQLGKCCPPGEIFSGRSEVVCTSAPRHAVELYSVDRGTRVERDGFPRCEDPEDVTTTPIDEVDSNDFLQVPACLEILHEQTSDESVPIVVHCRSNKDRDEKNEEPKASLPRLLDVRRCCPRNRFYDPGSKACVPAFEADGDVNYSEIDQFVSLLPNESSAVEFLKITRGPPTCKEVIFDYEIDAADILLDGDNLQVILPSLRSEGTEKITATKENTCFELTPNSSSSQKVLVRSCRSSNFCENKSCIRKCCSEDEVFSFSEGCTKLSALDSAVEFHESLINVTNGHSSAKEYGLLIGLACDYDMYPLVPEDKWTLTPEGYIRGSDYEIFQQHEYCMDVLSNSSEYDEAVHPLICFSDPTNKMEATIARMKLNTVLEAISCLFLLLTLLVYACLPALQNLHGKTLMCHAASLLLAYTCLAVVPWVTPDAFYWEDEKEPQATAMCSSIGYTMLFAFLSSFSWLNIMCFDIWRTFGGLRGSSTRGRAHRKRFLLYSLYSWGVPLFMTILGILSDQMQILPSYLSPNIGLASCWFTQLPELFGELVFFIVPIAIQLVSNVVFFVLTSMHCSKVKAEIRRVADPSDPRSKRFHADKTKLIMNAKLFVVMGISWVTEIVSFFLIRYTEHAPWQLELFYLSDALNCLQGLLIFILFVVKGRVYDALKRRLGFDQKKKTASQATTTLHDPHRVKKSGSSSTLTSNFAVSLAP